MGIGTYDLTEVPNRFGGNISSSNNNLSISDGNLKPTYNVEFNGRKGVIKRSFLLANSNHVFQ